MAFKKSELTKKCYNLQTNIIQSKVFLISLGCLTIYKYAFSSVLVCSFIFWITITVEATPLESSFGKGNFFLQNSYQSSWTGQQDLSQTQRDKQIEIMLLLYIDINEYFVYIIFEKNMKNRPNITFAYIITIGKTIIWARGGRKKWKIVFLLCEIYQPYI